MKKFSTKIQITAPVARVWALLADVASWPAWNTTIDRIEGVNALGSTVTEHAKINPGRAFPVKVTEWVVEQKIVWSSGMPFGLFKGERTYTLTPKNNTVEFDMTETYTGALSGMMTKSIPDLQPAFDEFSACLKRAAE